MHTHIGAHNVLIYFLASVVGFGICNLLAKRYEGHSMADAWLSMYVN